MVAVALTDARRAQLEGWLADAEDAYQRVMVGGQEASVSHGTGVSNSSVSFQAVKPEDILKRINQLRSQLGMCSFEEETGTNKLTPFAPDNYNGCW